MTKLSPMPPLQSRRSPVLRSRRRVRTADAPDPAKIAKAAA